MRSHSILLGLSGSEQSSYAAEVAWYLAKKLNASVTAEHVIDKTTIWELLRSDTPGFVGGKEYIEIFDSIIDSLKALADQLACKYEVMAAARGIRARCLTKEGNPIRVLCEDSDDYDMIVLGHVEEKNRSYNRDMREYMRHSIAEGVAHESRVPVLVVQSKPAFWDSMTIVSEIDHLNMKYIRSCLALAKCLGLRTVIEFWGTGLREETPESLLKNLLDEMPELQECVIDIEYFAGPAASQRQGLFCGRSMDQAAQLQSQTLYVLPTRGIGRERITTFGIAPEEFVSSMALPCLLLWPEDNDSLQFDDIAEPATVKHS